MKLYVCYGTFTTTPRPGGHPCGNAHRALREAGHNPEVIKSYGLGVLPDIFNRTRGRQEVKRLTGGSNMVPAMDRRRRGGPGLGEDRGLGALASGRPSGRRRSPPDRGR